MSRCRVLIADDHPSVLKCVSEMLSGNYDVVATVGDGLAAVHAAAVMRPDIVILDISMPIMSGLEVAARLADERDAPRILLLTVHEDPAFLEAAQRAGAGGYVLKRSIAADLLPAVRRVLDGERVFPTLSDLQTPASDHL